MIWLLGHPLPPSPVRKTEKEESRKAWSSINHSILFGYEHRMSLRITQAKLSLYFGPVHFLLKVYYYPVLGLRGVEGSWFCRKKRGI
jgi:hypothetical protein